MKTLTNHYVKMVIPSGVGLTGFNPSKSAQIWVSYTPPIKGVGINLTHTVDIPVKESPRSAGPPLAGNNSG
jgi:hypothetical protein